MIPAPLIFLVCIFMVHAVIRFGGLWNPQFIPLSMVIIWPLPWLLFNSEACRKMGFKAPDSWHWFLTALVAAAALLAFCAGFAWLVFGSGSENWFAQHALTLHEAATRIPTGMSIMAQFWILTLPAMIFSPLAEEFLYRGFMLTGFSQRWGYWPAAILQATAFGLVHLAHYGLIPFQPALILVWVPSIFVTGIVFAWIVQKSGSVWCAVVSHAFFNLGMNAIVFLLLPDHIGV